MWPSVRSSAVGQYARLFVCLCTAITCFYMIRHWYGLSSPAACSQFVALSAIFTPRREFQWFMSTTTHYNSKSKHQHFFFCKNLFQMKIFIIFPKKKKFGRRFLKKNNWKSSNFDLYIYFATNSSFQIFKIIFCFALNQKLLRFKQILLRSVIFAWNKKNFLLFSLKLRKVILPL